MKTDNKTNGLKLWSSWFLGSFLALIIGLALLIFGVGEAINNAAPAVFGIVIGAIFGTGLGIAQWLSLRKKVDSIGLWAPITIEIWVVFWALNFAGLFGEGQGVTGKLIEGIGHGAILGALSWAIGASTGDTTQAILQIDIPLDLILAILLSSALTGAGIVWLLRQPEYNR